MLTAFLFLLSTSDGLAQTKNGFDLSPAAIDPDAIQHGGPPRDGIPAIDDPAFVPVDKVDYLKDDDIVIGMVRGNTERWQHNPISDGLLVRMAGFLSRNRHLASIK